MPRPPSHEFVDHTSEVEVRLWAPTLAALYAEAGRAVAALMLDGPAGSPSVAVSVTVEAPDREALLVAWIDELVFWTETRRTVFTEFAVRTTGETRLDADIAGVLEPVMKTAVKAATFHALRVEPAQDGFAATVVLDV